MNAMDKLIQLVSQDTTSLDAECPLVDENGPIIEAAPQIGPEPRSCWCEIGGIKQEFPSMAALARHLDISSSRTSCQVRRNGKLRGYQVGLCK